ncbi:MAG: helix-turn-helix transcriptional regulator [Nevskiales bacterium]|nr:helix-turn-helix transcriptional regulator [Nevskiales bacterium]
MSGDTLDDLDRFVHAVYAAAFDADWHHFRQHALEQLCQWTGAVAAAWLTRGVSDLEGEYAVWPSSAAIAQAEVATLPFEPGARECILDPVPDGWPQGERGKPNRVLALRIVHRGTPMHSIVVLVLPAARSPDRVQLRRGVGHLAQAGTLSLSRFVQRDEWLQSLGRPSRGSAALVDASGGVYVSSLRFRELMREAFGEEELHRLPFGLPVTAIETGFADFDLGELHFRVAREGRLFMVHARRPHPLDVLSPREQQIARALANGKTFKSVARECDIAISTVANHASRIYRKLGIYRREELVGLLRRAAVTDEPAH